MKTATFTLEFITPCFCAGADQKKAEIRAPSIRGQLRWWFRALGGTREQEKREQEKEVFGGVHGDAKSSAVSSAVSIRVKELESNKDDKWCEKKPTSENLGYIWYYLGDAKKGGALAPGSRYELTITWRKEIKNNSQECFQRALEAFLRFGSLGYRATRCGGSFKCEQFNGEKNDYEKAFSKLSRFDFSFKFVDETFKSWKKAVKHAENLLKYNFRGKYPEKKGPSPLGKAAPRQTSAVYFRPIKTSDGKIHLLIFEAPHKRVLDEKSGRPKPILREVSLTVDSSKINKPKQSFRRR